jgi:hypothetical protein
MKYEETFTAFLDFLGFSEASRELDEVARLKVLSLLLALVGLRSEFSAASEREADGSTRYHIKPAISTFSDNIVISFGLETLRATAGDNSRVVAFLVVPQFERLVSIIAAQALRLGFLVRGAATIGKLYHANGVVFGEALIEAVELEKRTAVYPRVILSSTVTSALDLNPGYVKHEEDGIICVDYIRNMIFNVAQPGDAWSANVKAWFYEVVPVIQTALETHAQSGSLNKLSKWTWFAKRFRAAIASLPPEACTALGISIENIPWKA